MVPCTSLGGHRSGDSAVVGNAEAAGPEPGTLSGGTSSAPDRFTLIAPLPGIQSGSEEQAESASAALAKQFRYQSFHRDPPGEMATRGRLE